MPIGARGKVALGTALRIRGLAGFADAKHITTRDNADAHRTQAARINAMLLRGSDTKRQVSAIRLFPGRQDNVAFCPMSGSVIDRGALASGRDDEKRCVLSMFSSA